jgi:hypothetical protein
MRQQTFRNPTPFEVVLSIKQSIDENAPAEYDFKKGT